MRGRHGGRRLPLHDGHAMRQWRVLSGDGWRLRVLLPTKFHHDHDDRAAHVNHHDDHHRWANHDHDHDDHDHDHHGKTDDDRPTHDDHVGTHHDRGAAHHLLRTAEAVRGAGLHLPLLWPPSPLQEKAPDAHLPLQEAELSADDRGAPQAGPW
jgi:hypothetical protein